METRNCSHQPPAKMEEIQEDTSKIEEILDAFIIRHVNVREVVNNRLELATFIKNFMRLYKLWIDGEMNWWRVVFGWFIYGLTNTVIFVAGFAMIRYAFVFDEYHLSAVSTNISLVLALPMAYQLFVTFFPNQKKWQALLEDIGNFEVYEKPADLEMHEAKSELLVKLSMAIIFIPVPFISYYIVTANCPDPEDYSCGIMFPGYFPGCMGRFRPMCAFIHLFSSYSLSYVGYLASALYTTTSEYIVIYLKHFQVMLKKIPTIYDWEERRSHVIYTLKYHQRILELYDTYFAMVKDVFLIHIFGTPIVLAVLVYTFMTDFRIQNVAYSLLWLFTLSYVCYFGQRMVDESEAVTEIAYQSIPFDGDNRTARDLLFLILRSQKTLHTPAGSLTYCGKGLFVAVMKSMYSYLAVMQSTGATDID